MKDCPIGVLLRAAADGELSAADQRRLDEHLREHPGDASRIEFERALRGACERAMSVETPAGLRERLLERVGQEEAVAVGVAARGEQTRQRSFWQRPVLGWSLGLAAVVALAFSLTFLMGTPAQAGNYETDLAQFLATEHQRCSVSLTAPDSGKLQIKDPNDAPKAFRSLLGSEVSMPDLAASHLRFIGGGECHVPPRQDKSVHMLFEMDGPEGVVLPVSLFVKEYHGEVELEEGVTYQLDKNAVARLKKKKEGSGCDSHCAILMWKRGDLVYYLLAPCLETARPVYTTLEAAAPSREL